MESNTMKKQVMSGLFWLYAEKMCTQGIGFIISIILARMLLPAEYGIIAIVSVFITLCDVFVVSGLGTSLIQKKNSDSIDYSSAFWSGFGLSIILYLCLFSLAPVISNFYDNEILIPVIRVMGIKVIIASLNSIQRSYVQKNLLFKKFFMSTLSGTIISASVGIYMAYSGYGVWALVAQNLINILINTLVLLLSVEWKPSLQFSITRLKGLLNFGLKMFFASMITELYTQSRSLIVGKAYSAEALAHYDRGNKFPLLIIANVNQTIADVLFPTMSNIQDDKLAFKKITKKSVQVSSFVLAPLFFGMAIVAEPMIKLLLTDKWLPCVPFLQIMSIAYILQPLQTANIKAVQASGRSDLSLKLEILKKSIGFALLIAFIVLFDNAIVVSISFLIMAFFAVIINIYPNRKLINYGYREQFRDFLPPILLSIVMCIVIALFQYFVKVVNLFTFIVQVSIGIFVYLFGAKLCKLNSLDYLVSIVKELVFRKLSKNK